MREHGNAPLKIWWIPQVPGKPFEVPVTSLAEARLLLDTLAAYDLFQYAHRIKPDYSNAGGLMEYLEGEWSDWYDEDGDDIDHEKYARATEAKS